MNARVTRSGAEGILASSIYLPHFVARPAAAYALCDAAEAMRRTDLQLADVVGGRG
jgi:hypothetical protein